MKKISLDSNSDPYSADEKALAGRIQAGRTAAIGWMGISRKSSGRVADYLSKQGFSQDEIPLILASLREDDYLGDTRLARRVVRQRQGRQAESRKALALRMSRLGLDDHAIELALSDAEEDEIAACSVLKQRYGRLIDELQNENHHDTRETGRLQRYELAVKAARFLASRGFSHAIISKVLNQAGLTIDSFY